MSHNTLPEAMIDAIKALVKAHDEYCRQIEEMQAVANAIRTQIDRLYARNPRLTELQEGDKLELPKAIRPWGKPEEATKEVPIVTTPNPEKLP